jgi:glutathione synthase/RimK-type ligase-like ATP-grasp enzyme
LWVNNIVRDAAAAHKPWQLALAKEIGLTIPETLITNDPGQARDFWAAHPGKVIYKPFTAGYHTWRETRLLRAGEEALADTVRWSPVIFQQYVPAVFDLRITAIGPRLFAAEAHSQEGEYKVDVRFNSKICYRAHKLPDTLERKLLQLMSRLGLEYGAIDMRLTPEGEYVFLEINPAGQFLYVEQAAGIPLSEAFAEHLINGERVTPSSPH